MGSLEGNPGFWRGVTAVAGDRIDMENIARYLIIGGIVLILLGGGVYLAARFGIPFGRLPGDIRIEGRNGSFYFPIVTSIVLSILLTIILNLIIRFLNK
jgi:hypothetical protein